MKDVVSFETAKRLKEAGFPPQSLEARQMWYYQFNGDCDTILITDSEDVTGLVAFLMPNAFQGTTNTAKEVDFRGVQDYFAPTATDILRQIPGDQLAYNGETWVVFPPNDDLRDWEHENPAEACAAAWLWHLLNSKC